jgi:ribosomal protein L37AE/L43A
MTDQTIHECAWCCEERVCEAARAGSGYLWVCWDCASAFAEHALGGSRELEVLLREDEEC